MITTGDRGLYDTLLQLRTHGITKDRARMTEYDGGWDYELQSLGFNYRMPDILCALGTSQLLRAEEGLSRRQEIAARYSRELSDLPLQLPYVESGSTHAYHLYVIRSKRRAELFDHLKRSDIHAQVHYIPIHQQPYYLGRYGRQQLPVTEAYYQECLSLPMYPSLTEEEQTRVIGAIRGFHE